jgi:hypothetical protein
MIRQVAGLKPRRRRVSPAGKDLASIAGLRLDGQAELGRAGSEQTLTCLQGILGRDDDAVSLMILDLLLVGLQLSSRRNALPRCPTASR